MLKALKEWMMMRIMQAAVDLCWCCSGTKSVLTAVLSDPWPKLIPVGTIVFIVLEIKQVLFHFRNL